MISHFYFFPGNRGFFCSFIHACVDILLVAEVSISIQIYGSIRSRLQLYMLYGVLWGGGGGGGEGGGEDVHLPSFICKHVITMDIQPKGPKVL